MSIEESKVEAIFFAALEKQSPDDRIAYLDEVCASDPDLRQRVEALLNARLKLGTFLQGHAADMVATTSAPPNHPRSRRPRLPSRPPARQNHRAPDGDVPQPGDVASAPRAHPDHHANAATSAQ